MTLRVLTHLLLPRLRASAFLSPHLSFPLLLSTAAAAAAVTTTSSSPPPPSPLPRPRPLRDSAKLNPAELSEINLLVPRLCESGRLQEAVRLIDACLLTDPPLCSLPLQTLVRRLCSAAEPDMAHAMSLLTALKHNPRCSGQKLAAICSMLISSYFEHRRPREALKVLDWMRRPNSPCPPSAEVQRAAIGGLCGHGMTLEALRILKGLIGSSNDGVVEVGAEVRMWVYGSLLREARVWEAKQLYSALASIGAGCDGDHGVIMELLDQMIEDWRD